MTQQGPRCLWEDTVVEDLHTLHEARAIEDLRIAEGK